MAMFFSSYDGGTPGLQPFLALHSFENPAVGLKPQSFETSSFFLPSKHRDDSATRQLLLAESVNVNRDTAAGLRAGDDEECHDHGQAGSTERFLFSTSKRMIFALSLSFASQVLRFLLRQLESSLHGYSQCLHRSLELIKSSLEMCPCARLH